MGKFDLEKFVTSILSLEFDKNEKEKIVNWVVSQDVKTPLKIVQLAFYKALNEQGLDYEDGKIVEARPKAGQYYMCIKNVVMKPDNDVAYKKGKVYKCELNNCITDEYGNTLHVWTSKYDYDYAEFKEHFRLATEQEIEEISGNNGGISSNSELTEFERKLADMLYGWNSELNKESQDRTKKWAKELLDIARKQIEKEKVAQLKNTEAYNMGLVDGKAEALKNMPKWRKNKTEWRSVTERLYKGYYIDLEDLFYKLQKEE